MDFTKECGREGEGRGGAGRDGEQLGCLVFVRVLMHAYAWAYVCVWVTIGVWDVQMNVCVWFGDV